jgi:hypothetical protein
MTKVTEARLAPFCHFCHSAGLRISKFMVSLRDG